MQRLTACVICSFIFFWASEMSAQVFIDPGAGVVWNKSGGDPRPMINVGIHNLIFKRLGVYGTIELPARAGDNIPVNTQRDVVGGIIRLNDFISFFGGAGVFTDGFIARGFKPQEVRKEAGLMFNIPKARLNLDLGYSNTAGFSFVAGYIISFRKTGAKNPVREITRPVLSDEPVVKFDEDKPEPKISDSIPATPSAENLQFDSGSNGVSPLKEEIPKKSNEKPEENPVPESDIVNEPNILMGIQVLTSGFYAVNGVFRVEGFARAALDELRKSGFGTSGISFDKSSGYYYVWMLRSENDTIVKDFVIKKRIEPQFGGLWVLSVK